MADDDGKSTGNSDGDKDPNKQRMPWWAIAGSLALAVLLLLIYSVAASTFPKFWTTAAVVLLLGLAALLTGALLGFLFGIPRTPQKATVDSATTPGVTAVHRGGYEPSNNLEQVSDWLTKILVGAGLVQLDDLREELSAIGGRVGAAVGADAASAITQLTIVVFSIIGFLAGFLWTRVHYGAIQFFADSAIWSAVQAKMTRSEQAVRAVENRVSDVAESTLQAVKAAGQLTQKSASPSASTAAMDPAIAQKLQDFRAAEAIWDSDPVKIIFGVLPSEANGRKLVGSIVTVLPGQSLIMKLRVEATDGIALTSDVTFALHPTMVEPSPVAPSRGNFAEVSFYTEGWFHAAAIVDNGKTVLVLDLRTVPGVPGWFMEEE